MMRQSDALQRQSPTGLGPPTSVGSEYAFLAPSSSDSEGPNRQEACGPSNAQGGTPGASPAGAVAQVPNGSSRLAARRGVTYTVETAGAAAGAFQRRVSRSVAVALYFAMDGRGWTAVIHCNLVNT